MKYLLSLVTLATLLATGCTAPEETAVDVPVEVEDRYTDKETDISDPFQSQYFDLSFEIPSGYEVREDQDHILVAKSPYYTREIGGDNSFFTIRRYDQNDTRESRLALYRGLLKNSQESDTVVDGTPFLTLEGDDWGRFGGDGAGKVVVVFFDASWVEIIERPANSDQTFDPIEVGSQILSSVEF